MKSITADVSPLYSPPSPALQHELAKLTHLLGIVIGSEPTANALLQQLVSQGEKPTVDNLRDRLRHAIESGTLTVRGISTSRLSRLQASLELGKVLYAPQVQVGTVIDSPEVAANVVQAEIGWSTVEQFVVLALDIKHRLLSWKVLTVGDIQETLAPPSQTFKFLISIGASNYILIHNHPSGCTVPSPDDILLTQTFIAASQLLCLPILDHIIVSRGHHTSIRVQSTLWKSANEEKKPDRTQCKTITYRTASVAHDRGGSPNPSG